MTIAATGMVPEHDASTHAVPPLVWVDGVRRPDLAVVQITIAGPTGERTATVVPAREDALREPDEWHRIASLAGRAVRIAQPAHLGVGDHALLPLFEGRFIEFDQTLRPAVDSVEIEARCGWSIQLDTLISEAESDLTFRRALQLLNESAGLRLTASLVGSAALDTPAQTWTPPLRAGDLLSDLLTESGAFVDSRLATSRAVIVKCNGRPVELPWRESADESMHGQLAHRVPAYLPTRLTGVAPGQVVESTFELQPAWNAADENEAESQYAKSQSTDFDTYANVFRLWLLNEDGVLGGSAFDLTQLFNDGRAVPASPLRFGNALTRDEAGRSVGVVVEVSHDAGASWQRFGSTHIVLTDRAGIYLDSDALDAAWLTAVRSSAARLRVTATLTSPLATEAVRWRGNAFAGPFIDRRIDLSDRFAWRRVDQSSQFYAVISAGDREADTRDDRAAMSRWLAERAAILVGTGETHTLELPLAVGLSIGDRLAVPLEPSSGRRLSVVRITHDWQRHRTTLQAQPIGGRP